MSPHSSTQTKLGLSLVTLACCRPSCSVQSGGPCLSLGGELASACGHNRTSETGQPEFLGLPLQLEGRSSRLQQSETGVVWVIPRSTSLPFLQGSGCSPIPSVGQAQGCTAPTLLGPQTDLLHRAEVSITIFRVHVLTLQPRKTSLLMKSWLMLSWFPKSLLPWTLFGDPSGLLKGQS